MFETGTHILQFLDSSLIRAVISTPKSVVLGSSFPHIYSVSESVLSSATTAENICDEPTAKLDNHIFSEQ